VSSQLAAPVELTDVRGGGGVGVGGGSKSYDHEKA
jgi:hypothetical protein